MKLKYVDIENFRSIQAARVDFNPSCRTLVGINESGKSNILRALSMISKDFQPVDEDTREPLPREKSIQSAHILFVFSLETSETEKIYRLVRQKVLCKKPDEPFMQFGAKEISLKDFCHLKNEGIYRVNIITKKKSGSYWAMFPNYILLSNWKRPSSACPSDFQIQVGNEQVLLKKYHLVNSKDYPDIPDAFLEDANAGYANIIVGMEISSHIINNLPQVILWQYDEQHLLPPSIDIDSFVSDSDSCIPLKNMFTLAGIEDISEEIEAAKKISPNKLRNLLRRVSTHTTSHFQNVWKEYKEIKFALEPNGNTIEANIVEKNYWRMSQRSDGVKRFVTFLLHISANVKANKLSNALLLIDEPDVGLHPSGSRYLRDELINIGSKNNVVFSTHSIFMIDKENINRHIIIKKDNEKTSVANANISNFVDEEVLFNALNYTVFDVLQHDNIIFEGWRDKNLFKTAMRKIPETHSNTLNEFKNKLKVIGLCHAEGVKDIRNITPLIELANRKCLIISDSDTAAKEKQEDYKKMRGYGVWKRYDEISKEVIAETGEDFIKLDVFKNHVTKVKQRHPNILDEPVLNGKGRLLAVRKWLISNKVPQEQVKEIMGTLKDSIFSDLKPSDIDISYYDFLEDLSSVINSTLK